jgi:hypothetical protein
MRCVCRNGPFRKKSKVVAPMGTLPDFDGVNVNSPLRFSTFIYIDQLLHAMEVAPDLQKKITDLARALTQA